MRHRSMQLCSSGHCADSTKSLGLWWCRGTRSNMSGVWGRWRGNLSGNDTKTKVATKRGLRDTYGIASRSYYSIVMKLAHNSRWQSRVLLVWHTSENIPSLVRAKFRSSANSVTHLLPGWWGCAPVKFWGTQQYQVRDRSCKPKQLSDDLLTRAKTRQAVKERSVLI